MLDTGCLRAVLCGCAVMFVLSSAADAQRCPTRWDPFFGMSGFDAEVRAWAPARAPSPVGPALYAGGTFTRVGGVGIGYVAKWDGRAWTALQRGVDDEVLALAIHDDDGSGRALFAGGRFTNAGDERAFYIAKWTGRFWLPVGGGVSSSVFALHVFGGGDRDALYAGGNFLAAGGNLARRVARWDGVEWTEVGDGFSSLVLALTDYDDGSGPALVAAGTFRRSGDGETTLNRIARFDGRTWRPLGEGFPNTVQALAVFDDGDGPELYAGGLFRKNQGAVSDRIARWNGRQWRPVGDTLNGNVFALRVFDDGGGEALYVGGNFTFAGDIPVQGLAKWRDGQWKTAGRLDDLPRAMTVFDDGAGDGLYIGGDFSQAGGIRADHVAHLGCTRCDRIRRLNARCVGERARVRAVLRSTLATGTTLTLTLDDARSTPIVVNTHGKGTAKWRKVSGGTHKISLLGCPQWEAETRCGP